MAQSPDNDLMRPRHGDEAIPFQFRKFTGNRLDGQAKVVGNVEASERKVDVDRGHGVRPGSPRDMEEEGGDPLTGSRPAKVQIGSCAAVISPEISLRSCERKSPLRSTSSWKRCRASRLSRTGVTASAVNE